MYNETSQCYAHFTISDEEDCSYNHCSINSADPRKVLGGLKEDFAKLYISLGGITRTEEYNVFQERLSGNGEGEALNLLPSTMRTREDEERTKHKLRMVDFMFVLKNTCQSSQLG
jgi:hypothetical protein